MLNHAQVLASVSYVIAIAGPDRKIEDILGELLRRTVGMLEHRREHARAVPDTLQPNGGGVLPQCDANAWGAGADAQVGHTGAAVHATDRHER